MPAVSRASALRARRPRVYPPLVEDILGGLFWALLSVGLFALARHEWRTPSLFERPGVFESSSSAERRFWEIGRRVSATFLFFCAAGTLAVSIARIVGH